MDDDETTTTDEAVVTDHVDKAPASDDSEVADEDLYAAAAAKIEELKKANEASKKRIAELEERASKAEQKQTSRASLLALVTGKPEDRGPVPHGFNLGDDVDIDQSYLNPPNFF